MEDVVGSTGGKHKLTRADGGVVWEATIHSPMFLLVEVINVTKTGGQPAAGVNVVRAGTGYFELGLGFRGSVRQIRRQGVPRWCHASGRPHGSIMFSGVVNRNDCQERRMRLHMFQKNIC